MVENRVKWAFLLSCSDRTEVGPLLPWTEGNMNWNSLKAKQAKSGFGPKWLDPKAKWSEREASISVLQLRFLKGPSGSVLGASALRRFGSNREFRSFKAVFHINFPFWAVFHQLKCQDAPNDYKQIKEILREIWEIFGRDLGEIKINKERLKETLFVTFLNV